MNRFHKDSERLRILRLEEQNTDRGPGLSVDMWDRRMKNWKQNFWKENVQYGKAMNRVKETASYLRGLGLLGPETTVIDIGCGPGRFVSEFAHTARRAVGVDISPRAIEYARMFAQETGQDNTAFLVSDFKSMDLAAAGLEDTYDLAFCSLSPAVSGLEGLQKFMDLSRQWCCMNAIVSGHHELHERIGREVFQKDTLDSWNGKHFYSSFNLLFLSGYLPVTSYYAQTKENDRPVSREFAEISASIILAPEERCEAAIDRIFQWMTEHADENGNLHERSVFTYGRLLWNIHRTC